SSRAQRHASLTEPHAHRMRISLHPIPLVGAKLLERCNTRQIEHLGDLANSEICNALNIRFLSRSSTVSIPLFSIAHPHTLGPAGTGASGVTRSPLISSRRAAESTNTRTGGAAPTLRVLVKLSLSVSSSHPFSRRRLPRVLRSIPRDRPCSRSTRSTAATLSL